MPEQAAMPVQSPVYSPVQSPMHADQAMSALSPMSVQTALPVQTAQGVGSTPSSPSMRGQQAVNARMVNGVAVAAPGYIPKAGKLTIEDIEAELAMLTERMEFLNNALEEMKKEEWCVCYKQSMRFRIPFL